jgi:hypothetical protein
MHQCKEEPPPAQSHSLDLWHHFISTKPTFLHVATLCQVLRTELEYTSIHSTWGPQKLTVFSLPQYSWFGNVEYFCLNEVSVSLSS